MTLLDLKGTISSLSDSIIVTKNDGICLLANRAAKRLFQYKKKEMKGQNLGYFVNDNRAGSGKGYRKDGSVFSLSYVESTAKVDGLDLRLFTLYELPKKESVPSRMWLKHSTYLFTLLNGRTFEVLFVSPRIAEVLGFKSEELLGTCYLDHVVADDKNKIREIFEQIVSNCSKPFNSLIRLRSVRKSGEVYVMEISVTCVKKDGEMYLITAEKNITHHSLGEQKKMQEATQREFGENQGALKVASIFLHEVRNPLSVILHEVDTLETLASSLEQKMEVAQAIMASEEATLALNDFLLLSQINSGKYPLLNVPFSLSQVMKNVLDSLKKFAAIKKVLIDLKLDESVVGVRIGDPRKIHTLFDTLGQCSMQDMGENQKLSFSVSVKSSSNSHLLFLITATNTNLNQERAAFYEQLNSSQGSLMDLWDKASSLHFAAQAMHLVTVRAIVQTMKGAFHIIPDVEAKSVLYQVALHFEPAQTGVAAVTTPQKIEYAGALQRYNLHVLCVDDNPLNLSCMMSSWKKLGVAHCDVASTGTSALELAKQTKYDVILLDYYMPQMTGEEVARKIREMEEGKSRQAIILLCTGIDLIEDPELCTRAKADGIIEKPINLNHLADLSLNCLEKCMREKEIPHGGK